MVDVLPDSRLNDGDSTLNSLMVDWELIGGGTVRIEVVPVFCASCGKPYGHVPKENTVFVCWLCRPCHEKFGVIAGTYATSDEQFCLDVAHEMKERFGRDLTDLELFQKMERGELGTALTLLEKESPFKVYKQD